MLATALAAIAIIADDGGRASCSVTGGGSCSASTSGDALELLAWAAPPLLVLAALALAPALVGAAGAAAYLVFALLRSVSDVTIGESYWSLLLPAAAALALAVAARHLLLERHARQATA